MTPREKKLAIATATLGLLLVGYFAWDQVRSRFAERRGRIASLDNEIAAKELTVKKGRRASKRLVQYERRALPADRDVAASLYQDWLLDLVQTAGLEEAIVNAVSEHSQRDVYRRLAFSLSGTGKLNQLVTLLFGFYEFDHLHQIRRLQIRPIKDSRKLEVVLTFDALVLPAAANQGELAQLPNPWLMGKSLADFEEEILGRNLFAPPNHPPKLASISDKRVEVNKSLSVSLKATDPDPLDSVTYRLGESAPPGARLDQKTGRLSWTPKELGDYQFSVFADDDGTPPKSVERTVQVTVVEPPPPVAVRPVTPKLKFDTAKHTYLVGTVESRGRRQVWLQDRTSGKIHRLSEGDAVRFGSIDGTIVRIGDQEFELTTEEKRLLVGVGENLIQASILPPGGI